MQKRTLRIFVISGVAVALKRDIVIPRRARSTRKKQRNVLQAKRNRKCCIFVMVTSSGLCDWIKMQRSDRSLIATLN